ncbi:FxSxx-COOH system tetratricopeptide repeat protein [Streptomyces sp. NPDC005374]|uniref:FxSxx-COOH system tetratricopeptide repeat protein n=1 Tax=Streptomyces sp. NPDC005374 TaxID=3364713 RepID=UPI0036B8A26D
MNTCRGDPPGALPDPHTLLRALRRFAGLSGRPDAVVMLDDGRAADVWRQTARELAELLRRSGAFDRVAVRERSAGRALPGGPGRVLLLLADGWEPGWASGSTVAALARWAAHGPVAVVHLLPRTLWSRGALTTWPAFLRPAGRGAPGHRLRCRVRGVAPDMAGLSGTGTLIPVPVLELDAGELACWARLLTAQETGPVPFPITFAGRIANGTPSLPPALPVGPYEIVEGFQRWAPPEVFQLAMLLAGTPLTWPLVDRVRRLCVPKAGRDGLAQLFVYGLLRPVPRVRTDAQRVRWDFIPGVREELLAHLRKDELGRLVATVTEGIGQGSRRLWLLPGLMAEPHTSTAFRVDEENFPWLTAQKAVLGALSGPSLEPAARLGQALDGHLAERRLRRAQVQPLGERLVSRRPPASTQAVTDERGPEMVEVSRPQSGTRSGSTPAVWGNIPPQNANFIGREDLLDNLHGRLQRERATAVLPNALHGMGGVGKTALVVEYLYRRLSDYDVVWWIPAERTSQVVRSLAELALRMGLKTSGEAGTAVPAVLEALRRGDPYEDWLLVFDNAESPDNVRAYFPAGGTGNILVTSRNPQWSSVARPLEVDVFARPESVQLLRRRTPELTEEEADRLAQALGDLPLAVEQAAAWLAETGMSADEYLRLFEEKRLELLDETESPDYKAPVIAAWNVSLDQLESKNPAALQLLQVCSFCAPEPIPRNFFNMLRDRPIVPAPVSESDQGPLELDQALRDPIKQAQTIREIGRFSLARMDHRANAIQMHRLVQMALQARMTDEEQRRMRRGAHQLLVANDPSDPENAGHWDRYGELTPHVMASGAVHSDDQWVRALIINQIKYLCRWGDYDTGGELATEAHEVWRDKFGGDEDQTLLATKWLGVLNFNRGRYEDAARLNAEALESYRRTLGEDHPETLDALGNVAIDRRVQGEFGEALELSETIHRRLVRLNGDDDPETLRAAHNAGVSLRLAGLFKRARQLDEDTWNRKWRIFGLDHALSLVTRLGLIVDMRELGNYHESLTYQEDITSQCRRALGSENPLTMSCLRHLAVGRRKAGRHDEARQAANAALRRLLGRYGEHDPESLAANLEVTVNMRHSGELDEAYELGTRIHSRYAATFGATHPHTVAAQVNLAVTLRLNGDLRRALEIDEESHGLLSERLGDRHPLTLVCATNLASDRFALGDVEAARDLDTETLARSVEVFDENHPSVLACAANLALDLRATGEVQRAQVLHAETADRLGATLGSDHPAVLQALDWDRRANCDIDPMPL